jgi:hypothetical protein
MPFTSDGIRPDLIINPHALPSRMTIGQIVECLFGKLCTSYGAFGDCTAFQVKGPNYSIYGPQLVEQGFHSSGNDVLYNGMTGEQLSADIFIGPTYYMRLKHMVKDKINYRARGPNTVLTRQPVQGRANDGGLRIGEMERDGVLAHGMSYFLNESFMVRGESKDYYIAVCNKSGAIAIYNESRNLFLSPAADGPIKFNTNPDGTQNIMNLSRFGRSFSILKIPYSFKLLMQELQVMNVQMRIITEDNVDQLLSMSYSDNIHKLMKSTKSTAEVIGDYSAEIRNKIQAEQRDIRRFLPREKPEKPEIPEPAVIESISESSEYAPPTPTQYSPTGYIPNSPEYNPNSPIYNPNSPEYNPNSPIVNALSNEGQPMATATEVPVPASVPVPTPTSVSAPTSVPGPAPSILEVKPEPIATEQSTQSEGEKTEEKKALIIESSSSTTPETTSGVKKITI